MLQTGCWPKRTRPKCCLSSLGSKGSTTNRPRTRFGPPTAISVRSSDGGLRLESADWRVAAEVKADGHISLADAHAVALAAETDATLVVGADDDFDELPVGVDVTRFRDEGV
ncbi:hypothetical protein QA600_11315 [Natronococcus sp. A-GB1]|nr:hypothetical protein [Natronococcus sp. A-GB1]MDG5759928.1 hypothetical protein [Natronococcus sp. A-GB1]